MSLLQELKAAPNLTESTPQWALIQRMIPRLVPGATVSTVRVINTGAVLVHGRTPLGGIGNFYYSVEMEPGITAERPIWMGVDRYRDETERALLDRPFGGVVEPTPGAVVAWMAGVMLAKTVEDVLHQPYRFGEQ